MIKTVTIHEIANSSEKQEIFFDDIREELQEIKTKTVKLWETISECSKIKSSTRNNLGAVPRPEIQTLTINEPNPILAIIANGSKGNIIATIFDNEKEFEISSKDWLQSNDIEFLIEIIIVKNKNEVWAKSSNKFSSKVITSKENLEFIIKDLYLEVLYKNYFLNNSYFSQVIKTTHNYNLSEIKTQFLINNETLKFKDGKFFYPFSKFIRGNSKEYNFDALLNLWLKFLTKTAAKKGLQINPPSNLLPLVKDEREGRRLLPNNLNISTYRSYYNGEARGEIIMVYLRNSLIGLDKRRKAQIESLVCTNPKIGTLKVLPRHHYYSFKDLFHLFTIIHLKVN